MEIFHQPRPNRIVQAIPNNFLQVFACSDGMIVIQTRRIVSSFTEPMGAFYRFNGFALL